MSEKAAKTKSNCEFDILVRNHVYPDPTAIFSSVGKSLKSVQDHALIVLDTNALIVPYSTGKEAISAIKKTYAQLKQERRLFVPGQVAREFAGIRAKKLGDVLHQVATLSSKLGKVEPPSYPLLFDMPEYKEVVNQVEEANTATSRVREAVKKLEQAIKAWSWNDPVSQIYAETFTKGVVIDPPMEDADTVKDELRRRIRHKLPPGYKDSAKDDEGIGDFLIWKTILHLGEQHKKSTLFVSGEEKADWWHRSNGSTLYPRHELFDEYRRASGEHSFHIITLAELLAIDGAANEVVEEIDTQEDAIRAPLASVAYFLAKYPSFERAVNQRHIVEFPAWNGPPSITLMIKRLASQGVISAEQARIARKIISFRDALMHTRVAPMQSYLEEMTSILESLTRELANDE